MLPPTFAASKKEAGEKGGEKNWERILFPDGGRIYIGDELLEMAVEYRNFAYKHM